MKILVYQILDKNDEMLFAHYREWKRKCGAVDCSNYDLVWAGEVNTHDLEKVFEIFNTSRPLDQFGKPFAGHSMSVSDIVATKDGVWFCDMIGWRNIKDEMINSTIQ